MLAFLKSVIVILNRNPGEETPETVIELPVGIQEVQAVEAENTPSEGQVSSFRFEMNGECTVCLNLLMEAAPPPRTAAAATDDAAIDTVVPPRKRAKKNAGPKLEDSRSLDDTFATPCGHVFHAQCLKQWYVEDGKGNGNSQKASCPNCRKPVTKASLLQVFIGGGRVTATTSCSPGPSTSGAASGSSSCAPVAVMSPTPTPAPSGSRKRQAPAEVVTLDGPAAYEGNDMNELRDLHNLLLQDYNTLQQRCESLEEERDILKAQFLSLQPEPEQAVVNGNDNPTGASGSGGRPTTIASRKPQTAYRGKRRGRTALYR